MLYLVEGYDYLPVSGQNDATTIRLLAAGGWVQRVSNFFCPAVYASGRYGGRCLRATTSTTVNVPDLIKLIGGTVDYPSGIISCGFQLYQSSTQTAYISFYDSVNNSSQVSISFDNLGVVRVWRGQPTTGVLLGTSSAGTFNVGEWVQFEAKVAIDPVNGSVGVRLNTATVLTLSHTNTQATARSTFDSVCVGAPPDGGLADYAVDDLFTLDSSGATNNDYLGVVRIKTQFTAAPGDATVFTPVGAAANWQAANNPQLDDTLYDASVTNGDIDLYRMQGVVTGALVYGVQVRAAYRTDDIVSVAAQNVVKSGATQTEGVVHSLTGSYAFYTDIWEDDPNTSLGWTGAAVNAIQVGPRFTTED